MSTTGDQSALLVEVPAAEAVIAGIRWGLDPAAALGVPAHVTALFPFVAAANLDDGVRRRVAALAGSFPTLDLRFETTAWFGEQVLWLAPADPVPLRRLTAALAAAFPDQPPYGGEYDDVVPHLTVGMLGEEVDLAALRAAESRVTAVLPIAQHVDQLSLWVGNDARGSWHRVASYAFSD